MTFEDKERIRVVSLLSGGLDSQLAVCVLREQGIEVHGVVFDSPFFDPDAARTAASNLGIPLHVVNFSSDIISLLKSPPHGFGTCMNPCIDCHAKMLKRAGELMEDLGFDFLSTGEVLNQRPMSQNAKSLKVVAMDSGYADLVIRPLSAGLLPETRPEKEGWVDRAGLQSISGRSRKPQFQLARRYELVDYPSPAGGCRLTEPNFCRRLKDLQEHEGLDGVRSINLLRYGRHFRLTDKIKIIVGRNENDNLSLEGNAELYDLILKPEDVPGPTCLLPFTAGAEQIRAGAEICARYSDHDNDGPVVIRIRSARGADRIEVRSASNDLAESLRI